MKQALVTGAGGNLGRAVVDEFLKAGYEVTGTLTARETDPGLEHFEGIEVDLLDEEKTILQIDDILKKKGRIDAAVLTVGGFAMGSIKDTSGSDLLRQLNLNVLTAYHVVRPVFAQMIEQGGGRIFLIGSRPGSGMEHSKGLIAYGMAKSLLFRLAELLNAEGKGHNVVTCVVVPSTIDTPQNRAAMPKADTSTWVKPETIAKMIVLYCSDAAAALREPVLKFYND